MPRSRSSGGRATPTAKEQEAARQRGRYTAPITREQRQSPRWFPIAIVVLLVFGVIVIIANYAHVTPGGTKDWYLLVGIVSIVIGLVMATYYH